MRASLFALCAAFIFFWSTLLAAEAHAAPPDKETPTALSVTEPEEKPGTDKDKTAAKAEGKIIIHKRIWDASTRKWKPATPAHSWTFEIASGGKVVAEPTDEDSTPLPAGDYRVTEKASPSNPAGYALVDFIKNTEGGSNCPDDPAGNSKSVSIAADEFDAKGDGSIHLCAYNKGEEAPAATAPAPATVAPGKVTKAKGVTPLLECVADQGGGKFTAYFGYKNNNADSVTIEVGEKNNLSPDAGGSAPPAEFQPGRSPAFPNAAFSVVFDGKDLVWTLTGPDGKTATVAASGSSKACAKPKLIKEFVAEKDGAVIWKLRPSFDADMVVWDATVEGCTAGGGAACGDIVSGGYGKFYAKGSGQYMEVTQKYAVKDGKKCEVRNTAEYVTAPLSDPLKPTAKVTAKYECSGATALGWPLLGLGFMTAVAAAWVYRRKRA